MSRIIEKLQSRYTGMNALMNGKQLPLMTPCETRPTMKDMQGIAEEFEMRVYISTLFVCNPAQRYMAEEHARKMIARHLYRDVHHAIDRMHMLLDKYENPYEMRELLDKLADDISE